MAKKIIIKGGGDGEERVEIEVDGDNPECCTLGVYSPDGDMCGIDIETAQLLNATAEILKEIR